MSERHWSEQQETTSAAGISVLLALFHLGGRFVFFSALWPVVLFVWIFSPAARRASRNYLEHIAHVRGAKEPGPFATFAHFWRFADTILDKLLTVSGFFGPESLAVEGAQEIIDEARGAVIVTAHTGRQELCQFLGDKALADHKVYVLTHTVHAKRFSEIIAKLNPKFAINHIQVTDTGPATAVMLSEIIEAGHWVVIVADRTPIRSRATVTINFMGEDAPVALGPFLLAMLLKCPAWSMICTRETKRPSPARYRVRFSKIYDGVPVARSKRDETMQRTAAAWATRLQAALLESPLDWFNFFDFWNPASPSQAPHRRH